jgi:hypothetical protein
MNASGRELSAELRHCVIECVALCMRVGERGGGMRVRHMGGNMRMALTLLDFLFWFGDTHKTAWACDSTVYTCT